MLLNNSNLQEKKCSGNFNKYQLSETSASYFTGLLVSSTLLSVGIFESSNFFNWIILHTTIQILQHQQLIMKQSQCSTRKQLKQEKKQICLILHTRSSEISDEGQENPEHLQSFPKKCLDKKNLIFVKFSTDFCCQNLHFSQFYCTWLTPKTMFLRTDLEDSPQPGAESSSDR